MSHFEDVEIVTFNTNDGGSSHDHHSWYGDSDNSLAYSILLNHRTNLRNEMVKRRKETFEHLEILLGKIEDYDEVVDFLTENPFPDNNLKLVFMKILPMHGYLLEYASESLRNDKELVLLAIQEDRAAIQFASDELKNFDREVASIAVAHDGFHLQYLSDELKADFEIVKLAIEFYSGTFQYASEELRGNKQLAYFTLDKGGSVLEFCSEELKGDIDIVIRSLNRGDLFSHVHPKFKTEKDLCLKLLKGFYNVRTSPLSSLIVTGLSDELKHVYEVVLLLNGMDLKEIPEEMQRNRDLVLKSDESVMQYVLDEFKSDKEIALAAILAHSDASKYIAAELMQDRE